MAGSAACFGRIATRATSSRLEGVSRPARLFLSRHKMVACLLSKGVGGVASGRKFANLYVDAGEMCQVSSKLGVDRLHPALQRLGVGEGRVGVPQCLLQCAEGGGKCGEGGMAPHALRTPACNWRISC